MVLVKGVRCSCCFKRFTEDRQLMDIGRNLCEICVMDLSLNHMPEEYNPPDGMEDEENMDFDFDKWRDY